MTVSAMISMDEVVRAARLAPSVGPFTIRRLMFRAGVFTADGFSSEELTRALPGIHAELAEILSPAEYQVARRALDDLIATAGARG